MSLSKERKEIVIDEITPQCTAFRGDLKMTRAIISRRIFNEKWTKLAEVPMTLDSDSLRKQCISFSDEPCIVNLKLI